MYVIKVDTEFLKGICGEYKNTIENMCYASEEIKAAADSLSAFNGFGIEEAAEKLYREAQLCEKLGEKAIDLTHKTKHIIDIYERAEEKIKGGIDKLPVPIHGNIAEKRSASEILCKISGAEYENIEESSLLYDNTVMHEDWLIKLIAKNKFGG